MDKTKQHKILFVGTQMTVGGAQKVLLQLANWFHQRGYPVTAAFFYDRDNLGDHWRTEYTFRILTLGNWKRNGRVFMKIIWLFKNLFNLFRLMRKEHFTAVLAFTHHSSLLALPLAWLVGIPIRLASHRGRIQGFPRWQEKLHAWMVNAGLATNLVAVSKRIRLQSIEEGIQPEKILIIENGVQVPKIEQDEVDRIRRIAGVNRRGFLILSVGRLGEEKGHIYLVRAMPAILQAIPDAILALVGDGDVRPTLEAEASKLGVSNNIRFMGVRTDVNSWMAGADVFVLPSNSEGMPNALLEAMGLGSSVVATRVGGVPEIIQDGQNGCLVPPRDPEAIVSTILMLYQNPTERRRLGLNAREMIRRDFSMEAMCEHYRLLLCPASNGVLNE